MLSLLRAQVQFLVRELKSHKPCGIANAHTNEHIYETKTNSQTQATDLWLPRRRRWGREGEFGISRCKLLCTEWINNILLCSTGNYIQQPVINHNGKEKECEEKKRKEKEYIYIYTHTHTHICMAESLCYTAEINITL